MEIDAIQKLIEVDENVRAQIQQVYEQRQQLKQAIEDEKQAYSKQAWEQVNQKLAQTKKELDEKIVRDDEKNQKYYQSASKQIQALFDAHHEEWRKKLYQRVIQEGQL